MRLEKHPKQGIKITRTSVVEQIRDVMKHSILTNEWKPNDKIPSETELANLFGVNRLSVRLAIQKLNTLGLTETRVGDGTYVKEFSLKPVLSQLTDLYADQYEDVTELRYLLEKECFIRAVKHATEDDIDALKKALLQYELCTNQFQEVFYKKDNDPGLKQLLEVAVDADFNFHYQIIKISKNRLFKDVYYMTQELVRQNIMKLFYERSIRRKKNGLPPLGNEELHHQIYECIKKHDEKMADDLIGKMLGIIPVLGLDDFD